MDGRLLAFLGVAVVLIVTPGPDTALTVRNALAGGHRTAFQTALGIACGQLVWGAAAAGGIAAVLAASALAFSLLKLAGAVFLVVLGARSLLAAWRGDRVIVRRPAGRRWRSPYLQGFANNLLNPKAAVIFISVFPAFVHPGDPGLRLAFMVVAFAGMTLAWLSLYAIVLGALRRELGPRLKRWLDATAGSVMVGLGARLALERS